VGREQAEQSAVGCGRKQAGKRGRQDDLVNKIKNCQCKTFIVSENDCLVHNLESDVVVDEFLGFMPSTKDVEALVEVDGAMVRASRWFDAVARNLFFLRPGFCGDVESPGARRNQTRRGEGVLTKGRKHEKKEGTGKIRGTAKGLGVGEME
jgi:hypothetical protein